MTGPFKGKPAWSQPITRLIDRPGGTSEAGADWVIIPVAARAPPPKNDRRLMMCLVSIDDLAHAAPGSTTSILVGRDPGSKSPGPIPHERRVEQGGPLTGPSRGMIIRDVVDRW